MTAEEKRAKRDETEDLNCHPTERSPLPLSTLDGYFLKRDAIISKIPSGENYCKQEKELVSAYLKWDVKAILNYADAIWNSDAHEFWFVSVIESPTI
ncbi:unnamed protein product [Larinioides sclopetarius]|uniref:Uncharacterized protein n=1 Tax=Larinioides sclopetarius TaxID=280406 RepID=A0AAV2BR64_9ARAC